MRTLALVIGNNNYYANAKLDNALNDATAIKNVFEKLGFDIIFKEDMLSSDIEHILTEFQERIGGYDASIFYFAGHGFEKDGENYLAAVDCQVADANKHHCERHCIRISEILNILKGYSSKTNIVIIDACRKSFDRSGSIGLSPIHAPKGTLIAYSTSPNEGASDVGFEGNSIFTGALLKYIGRERLSVEELFKKVRKTVYAQTEGRQTTWEHTSLIGDYYFNNGQLVFSKNIPYDEMVVRDSAFRSGGDWFSESILQMKIYNWHIQNPAIEQLLSVAPNELNNNQLFILGRNLLQASGAAHNAQNFMQNLRNGIIQYNLNGTNHLLNGILYEIYYDSLGNFRKDRTKKYYFEQVMSLRKFRFFNTSFEFIKQLLVATQYPFIYIPESEDKYLDIDVVATEETISGSFGGKETVQIVSAISFNAMDITDAISKYFMAGGYGMNIQQAIADFLSSPLFLVKLNCKVQLNKIAFAVSENKT